jgi:hypothetical protein
LVHPLRVTIEHATYGGNKNMKKKIVLMLAFLLLLPLSVSALDDDDDYLPLKRGSVSFRIGGFFPRGNSDIWEDNTYDLTYEVSDFRYFTVGMEVNWFLNRFITLGVALEYYSKSIATEYRDYIGADDMPVSQEIRLTMAPATGTFKFTPLGNGSPGYGGERGSSIVPWVGAGIGAYTFTYEEYGEFIDFSDPDLPIFEGWFIAEDEVALGYHFAGGIVIPIGFDWDVFGEIKYVFAEGDMGDDFHGFDPIDLGGLYATFGLSYRF